MSDRHDDDLQRYFDGELSLSEAKRVYQRIAADPEDQLRLEALGDLRVALTDAAGQPAKEADFSLLWSAVEQGIAEHERPKESMLSHLFLRWALVGASALAAVILAVVLLHPLASGATSTIFTIADPELADATTVLWVDDNEGDM
jgi:anti-sigma factor RsiW